MGVMVLYKIDGYNIILTKGDSLYIRLILTKDGEPFIPYNDDIIRFAMKRKYKDSDDKVLVNKVIPNDTLILKIEPEDTKNLRANKIYVYDIQITSALGDVNTFITGSIRLPEEVI